MAESTLSISYSAIQREVARFLGWTLTVADWTTDQDNSFGDILASGLRKFYYPPTGSDQPVYEWSFLRPTATLSLTSGDYDYDLPDDFTGVLIEDSITLGSGNRRLKKIFAEELVALRDKEAASNDTPLYFAVRQKAHVPATGLRYEALFYPTPDASYTATYRYLVAPDTLDGTNIYPYGGAMHSETILEAVLAAAEEKIDNDPQGVHYLRFMECLGASIRTDRAQRSAQPDL